MPVLDCWAGRVAACKRAMPSREQVGMLDAGQPEREPAGVDSEVKKAKLPALKMTMPGIPSDKSNSRGSRFSQTSLPSTFSLSPAAPPRPREGTLYQQEATHNISTGRQP
nr:unnamed protein product [Digitaria exilis]